MNADRVLTGVFLLWAMGLVSPADAQTVRYVATTGTDAGSCTAPGAPCRTPQYAVSQAASHDEVRVAAGSYGDLRRTGTNWAILEIDRSVSIKGGYAQGDWSVSDPALHPTILDAGYQYTIVTTSGTFQSGEAVAGSTSGAGATVVAIDGVRFKLGGVTGTFVAGETVAGAASGALGLLAKTFSMTVSGGTFQSGETLTGGTSGATGRLADVTGSRFAVVTTSPAFQAGETLTGGTSGAIGTIDDIRLANAGRVIRIAGKYRVDLEALTLTNGLADEMAGCLGNGSDYPPGGGLYVLDATVTLSQVTVLNNVAAIGTNHRGCGGGLYAQDANVTIADSTIQGNRSGVVNAHLSSGGGIYAYHGRLVIDRSRILDNQAGHSNDPGGYTGHGGGVYAVAAGFVLRDSLVQGNRSINGQGAGLLIGGGGVLVNNRILDNVGSETGSQGGGLYMSGPLSAARNFFVGNTAAYGGAVYAIGSGTGTRGRFDNNVIVRNTATGAGAGLYVVSANMKLRHNTLSANAGGAGITLGTAAVLDATNTIVAGHGVGVDRTVTTGSAVMDHTLWDANTTNTSGTVTNTNPVTGAAALAGDGFHLTLNSAAVDAGVPVGVGEDVDAEIRFRGRAPDVGADESSYSLVISGNAVSFEQLAAPPRWLASNCSPSIYGCVQQDYYLRFTNGLSSGVTVNSFALTDTLSSGLRLDSELHVPLMTMTKAGQELTYGSTGPLAPGEWGWVRLYTSSDTLTPGAVMHNTATFTPGGGPPLATAGSGDTTVPLLAPLITFPGNGEIAKGSLTVAGMAQPNVTVRLYENGTILVGTTTTSADGRFTWTYTSTRVGIDPITELHAVAIGAGSTQSPSSAVITLFPTSGFFCPQRSKVKRGFQVIPFRDAGGMYSAGSLDAGGRWSRDDMTYARIDLSLATCSSGATPTNIRVTIESNDGSGADVEIFTGTRVGNVETFKFDWPPRKIKLGFIVQCDVAVDEVYSVRGASGIQLIDPDGYVFDVTRGFDSANPTAHALAGAKVTAYAHVPEWGGWVVWPAEMYENQVNPQTTGNDGYFAFFTPPGRYYLQVENAAGFQTWRSPVVTVVNEIVHVNVPLTPTGTAGAPQFSISPAGVVPPTRTIPVGGTIEWVSSLASNSAAGDVMSNSENPVLNAAVTAKDGVPITALTSTLGFDSGMLAPGQVYRRQFTAPGTFTFADGAGHTGTVVVAAGPAPTVQGVAPASGSTMGGTAVTITGTNFVAGATVSLGGAAATAVAVTSTTTITAVTPAHAAGAVNLVVTNPDAQAATLASAFTYVLQPQSVTLALTPTTLRFAGTNANGTLGPITTAQSVTVSFSAPTSSTWTATASQPWLHVTNGAGTGSGTFTVGLINPSNVLGAATSATATVTVTASGASNSPQTIEVILTLRPAAAHVAPFGLVDTPRQNAAGVVGTIGVTGWVVDDVGITGVKVYRNCLAFEPTSNCVVVHGAPVVFVGDATLVSGARPDVEALYPTYPQAYRAAWGYLLLTNLLPHVPREQMYGGQGAMTLAALATDVEGKQTWLGRTQGDQTPTTITMTNDSIAVPFGAIDTPGQGQTVGGTVANFGWALTPDADTTAGADDIVVPTTGTTIQVYVDGVPRGTVTFNQCRGTVAGLMPPAPAYCDDDVASIFGNPAPLPTFTPRTANPTKHRNLDAGRGAIGAFLLDTTTLSNGVHTIMWGVQDSAGRGEGIGSRFFTVLNTGADAGNPGGTAVDPSIDSGSPRATSRGDKLRPGEVPPYRNAPVGRASDAPVGRVFPALSEVEGRPGEDGDAPAGVRARTGFDLAAPWSPLVADDAGVRYVQLANLGRLELQLGPVDAGYLEANGEPRDLPAGSHLEAATGHFTWAPGVGYFGTYRLVFARASEPIAIDVTVRPIAATAPGAAEIRMSVDAPVNGALVTGPFTVAGWALDPQAPLGSGIDAVHVWAQRTDVAGAEPQFLGSAALGGVRPDVAQAFGPQHVAAGFSLTSDELVPGRYAITAYVWNHRTARWEDARTTTAIVR